MNKEELLKEMQKKDECIINEGHKHNLFEYCFCAALNELKHKSHEYDTKATNTPPPMILKPL